MFFSRRNLWTAALAVIAVLFVLPAACTGNAPVRAETSDESGRLAELERIAEHIYEAAKAGDVELSRGKLDQYTALMVKISYDGITGAEGLQALTQTLIEAKETFNRIRFSRQEGVIAAVKLRLVTDALSRRNAPLWLEYHSLLARDAGELKAAVEERNAARALKALEALRGHYGIIRPSALVSREPAAVEKMDSLLAFLSRELAAKPPNFARSGQGIEHLEAALSGLFGKDSETGAPVLIRQPPAMWTGVITAAIVTVLAYVGWQKYNAQKRLSLRRPRD